jgi:hypothetical protein
VSPARTRAPALDDACAGAVDLARDAAAEMAGPDGVGEHISVSAEEERVAVHLFGCLARGYHGWRWAVTVSRASRARAVTVSEVVLLPGPDSLLAPEWVPWSDRVRPGDLGVGDLMPAAPDDERLVPAAAIKAEEGLLDWDGDIELAALGLPALPQAEPESAAPEPAVPVGRARVLSAIGRDLTAERWYASEHGPGTPLAKAAPGACLTCGFLTPLAGSLGRLFGVCANEYAPDDGRVVSFDHGCGAHSEAVTATPAAGVPPVIDETGYDLVDMPGVALADTEFESLDRSS